MDNAKLLQYMAFMPEESYAPFFDINLFGHIEKPILTETYRGTEDSEFLRWTIITGIRKVKNKNIEAARTHFDNYIAPRFPGDSKIFIKDPIGFFEKQFPDNSYKDVIDFLSRT